VCLEYGIPALRVLREKLGLSLRADPGRLLSRAGLSALFALLARNCARDLTLQTSDHVLGLFLDGRMTRDRLLALLEALPPGTTEIYSHPSLDGDPQQALEFEALVAPEVRSATRRLGINLTCYRDAPDGTFGP
jgi:hypothetical protein